MHAFVRHLFLLLAHLGPWGLIILGVLDSSFLFMPLGNDLLVIGLTSRHPKRLLLYAPCAAAGSLLGCFLLDLIARKEGEEGLEKLAGKKRLDYLKKKIAQRAGFSLAFASLAPPPFPFTPVVAAASAFDYPRIKMFSIIGASRLLRFTIVGLLAVFFGQRILSVAKSPVFEGVVLALLALFVGGSVISIVQWWKRAKKQPAKS